MDLPQIEVVGAEVAQGRVELVEERAAGGVADDLAAAVPETRLAGQHHLVPRGRFGEQGAEQQLALAVAVDGSGVDERAAGLEERGELLLGLDLVDAGAERHRAEPEARHPESGATDATLLHDDRVIRWLNGAR